MATNNSINQPTATSGQVWTANGVGTVSTFQAAPSSGALVLLQTQTPSGASTISFTSTYITSTYKTYVIIYDNLTSTGSTMNMTVSTDNGSNYQSTNYASGNWYFGYNSATVNNQNTTSSYQIATGLSTTLGSSGTIWFYGGGQATSTNICGHSFIANTYWQPCFGSQTSTTVNNIKFAVSASTITGTITLYGVSQ